MTDDTIPPEGDERTYSRTFTREEVDRFGELSRDDGYQHVVGDGDRVVLHGLLTATMPTKLGGDFDFIAQTMEFEFPRPAYSGEELTCTATAESVTEDDDRYRLTFSFHCTNPDGEVVLRGESEGVVLKAMADG